MSSTTQAACILAAFAAATTAAHAQSWPSRPIRLIVPFAPGGAVDLSARTVAQAMAPRLGQPLVIENRGGAGGNLGVELVTKAAPDGYTLVMATSGQVAINPHMYARMSFDPLRDLAPITPVGQALNVLSVHPALPVKTVKDYIALAKTHPGKLTFASGGTGASDHIATELFMSMAGIRMTHVPYKGGAPAMLDLLAGNVDSGFSTVATAIGPIRTGRLRALGLTSAKRFELLPDVPTIAEAGLPGYESVSWYGLFAPAGTPAEIVNRVNADAVAALQGEDVRKRMVEFGVMPVSSSPAAFATYIAGDHQRWGKVIRAAGIKAE
ncbi:MAG: Bug family tripartite tricarboxylate transporter substrate binding protein [bacterium]|nr:tripartite tricarboxylate transporter substrate binding protein [Betaproteobacteria bacterium]